MLLYSPAQDGKHIKCFPLRAELATNLTPALSPGDPPGWPRKIFSKKLLRGGQTSVYTNPRSARERKQTRTSAWGVSSVWLERRPVTSEVAGSSPAYPAIVNSRSPVRGSFLMCARCARNAGHTLRAYRLCHSGNALRQRLHQSSELIRQIVQFTPCRYRTGIIGTI